MGDRMAPLGGNMLGLKNRKPDLDMKTVGHLKNGLRANFGRIRKIY